MTKSNKATKAAAAALALAATAAVAVAEVATPEVAAPAVPEASKVAPSQYKQRAAFTAATKEVAASQLFARTEGEAGPDLRGDIEGVSTMLYMAKGTDRKFFNVLQNGVQVGTANVRVMPRGIEALVVNVGEKATFLTFLKGVSVDQRVAYGLDTEKLAAARAANQAAKAAANDEKAAVAA